METRQDQDGVSVLGDRKYRIANLLVSGDKNLLVLAEVAAFFIVTTSGLRVDSDRFAVFLIA